MRLFRVILPADDLEASVAFYSSVFQDAGRRVSPGRHYFDCGDVILAVVDPHADGDPWKPRPNFDHVYFSVADLEGALARVTASGVPLDTPGERHGIAVRPWGERSFYAKDPFGNPICFVEAGTEFTGRA